MCEEKTPNTQRVQQKNGRCGDGAERTVRECQRTEGVGGSQALHTAGAL